MFSVAKLERTWTIRLILVLKYSVQNKYSVLHKYQTGDPRYNSHIRYHSATEAIKIKLAKYSCNLRKKKLNNNTPRLTDYKIKNIETYNLDDVDIQKDDQGKYITLRKKPSFHLHYRCEEAVLTTNRII